MAKYEVVFPPHLVRVDAPSQAAALQDATEVYCKVLERLQTRPQIEEVHDGKAQEER